MVSPTLIGQPVVTTLLAIPLLGEALRTEQWLGGLVVLAGIYLVHRSREGSKAVELTAPMQRAIVWSLAQFTLHWSYSMETLFTHWRRLKSRSPVMLRTTKNRYN